MGDRRAISERRAAAERRHNDRRRLADQRQPVFEICRSMLYLATVVDADPDMPSQLVTRSIRWRREATSIHTEQGLKELAAAFQLLVHEERLTGAVAGIALSGELCVTRVLMGPSSVVRRELSDLEDRSRLYLSLGPGQKAKAEKISQLDARHQHLLLTVTNQKTLDLLTQIADTVGITLAVIEPSLVALARAQARLRGGCQEACLIIQLDERGAELGICQQGKLMLDYRPAGRGSAGNVADIVVQHIKRLERYLHRCQQTDAKLKTIYLAGAPGPVELARARFSDTGRFDVRVLNPSEIAVDWEIVGDTPGTELAAAIGTAIAIDAETDEMIGPNLMENLVAGALLPMKATLLRSALPLAATLLIAVGLLLGSFWKAQRAAGLNDQLNQLAPVVMRAKELRLSMAGMDTRGRHLVAISQGLPERPWAELLTHVGQSMPDDVWLDRISVTDAQLGSLSGASYADASIYDFVQHLGQVPRLDQIAIQGTGVARSTNGPTTSFDLEFLVTDFNGYEGNEDHDD